MVAAGLGEVAAGDDAEFRGKRLEKHREEIADEHDAEKRVAEFGAAADVGGPVAVRNQCASCETGMLRCDSGREGRVRARRQAETSGWSAGSAGAVENRLEKMSDIVRINYS